LIKRANRHQHQQRQQYRINQRIFANELRVLDAEGKQVGVMNKNDALRMAQEQELDLVEIAPAAKPPVAKLIDYKKFLYQQDKKKREEKRKAKISDTKELRLGPFISENDLQVIIRRGREFIEDGDKVRLVVKFRGRQIVHPEFGKQILDKVIKALSDVSKVEREPHLEGKQMITVLSVMKGKKQIEENTQASY
jgi:translation initiation factor IF-3